MMSEDLSRRMMQKRRAFDRRTRERAMQRTNTTHSGRQLAHRVTEASYSSQNRDKIRVMSTRGS